MTKVSMNSVLRAAVLGLLTLAGACQLQPKLDTRTFEIRHLAPYEVQDLVGPYVYTDRAEAPGSFSVSRQLLTVRETPDNLDKIERMLAEYDTPHEDVRLHFQLIEADGFTGSDPRIEAVEAELRKVFQFKGYRLAADAVVRVADASSIAQRLTGSEGTYHVTADVQWVGENVIRLQHVTLYDEEIGEILETSVNVRPGQTLVLGSSPRADSRGTLLLTLRADMEE